MQIVYSIPFRAASAASGGASRTVRCRAMPKRANPYERADRYTHAARERGYPARSVFKLEDLDRRAKLLRPGMHVLDLGAAPGSWTRYAAEQVGPQGRVLAVDLTPLATALPANATAIQGDAFDLADEALAAY